MTSGLAWERAKILDEPALREVEESTRRLLADIRLEDPFMPHWAADSGSARLRLPRVPPDLTFRSAWRPAWPTV